MAELAKAGPQRLIRNVASTPMVLRYGGWSLPVTVESGGYGQSYVVSPHSHYVLYARDEIDIIGIGAGRTAAKGVLATLSTLLHGVRINHAVHLDNWLLSTNLHGDWSGQGLPQMRAHLAAEFPDRLLIIRSLDQWSCPQLLETVRDDGWMLLPARQIWVTDDLRCEWKKRNNTANDRRALNKSGLLVEEPEAFTPQECERIADLYRQLYVGRYSAINPVFTPAFIDASARTGLLHYRIAREPGGRIMAVCGMRAAGGIVAVPLLGYDMARPQSEALYRIASYMASEWAMVRGLRFNGSAGAGKFKQMRGARSEIEYMAVYARHLPPIRRAGLAFLARALNTLMVPLLRDRGW
ncbi:hypothetical protein [Qipengyuania sp. ASV99]|uniref:hypothetical protein n=1 Tax=Qipengyuania sp. ASV99 TaxID=3399681 RepID=UPI003A4C83F6